MFCDFRSCCVQQLYSAIMKYLNMVLLRSRMYKIALVRQEKSARNGREIRSLSFCSQLRHEDTDFNSQK